MGVIDLPQLQPPLARSRSGMVNFSDDGLEQVSKAGLAVGATSLEVTPVIALDSWEGFGRRSMVMGQRLCFQAARRCSNPIRDPKPETRNASRYMVLGKKSGTASRRLDRSRVFAALSLLDHRRYGNKRACQ